VARIRAQFELAKDKVGFKGTLKEFFQHLNTAPELRFKTREEIQAAYEAIRPKVEAKQNLLFAHLPKAPFEIRPVEGYREVSAAPASYQRGSVDGKRPGVLLQRLQAGDAHPLYYQRLLPARSHTGPPLRAQSGTGNYRNAGLPPLRRQHGLLRRLGLVQ
jgi:uncharacterized protein (DUF885 family)